MAGIGFTLKKMFKDESYSKRGKAYLYSAFVAAGPWIAAVITVNILILIMEFTELSFSDKELFMGTIVYSFIFSQIVTSPWQMIITRYISDRLFAKEYHHICPSFIGLNKIIFFQGLVVAIVFYWDRPLPISYKIMGAYLFVLLGMIWILMVYLSAVKNYELIGKAYVYGGLISIALTIYLAIKPIGFSEFAEASNILLGYLIGISVTYIILLYNFLVTFYFGNNLQFDFLRYLSRLPSLFYIGLFYTVGLWVDDILMWFSDAGNVINQTYLYAPVYDNAMFLAYLTTIPSSVLFLVSVETEFYDTYKKYYGLVNRIGTYQEIDIASKEMKETIYRKLLYTFQVQTILTVTIVLFSKVIFDFFNHSILIRNIFRICSFGALFNIFILLIILVLLYYESRKRALIISLMFLVSNSLLTYYYSFIIKDINYYGYGFTIGSFITLIVAIYFLTNFLKKINFVTFALHPLFQKEEKGIFVKMADRLNYMGTKGNVKVGKVIKEEDKT
jgi:polysaccharide biosynthesis protein PelG